MVYIVAYMTEWSVTRGRHFCYSERTDITRGYTCVPSSSSCASLWGDVSLGALLRPEPVTAGIMRGWDYCFSGRRTRRQTRVFTASDSTRPPAVARGPSRKPGDSVESPPCVVVPSVEVHRKVAGASVWRVAKHASGAGCDSSGQQRSQMRSKEVQRRAYG